MSGVWWYGESLLLSCGYTPAVRRHGHSVFLATRSSERHHTTRRRTLSSGATRCLKEVHIPIVYLALWDNVFSLQVPVGELVSVDSARCPRQALTIEYLRRIVPTLSDTSVGSTEWINPHAENRRRVYRVPYAFCTAELILYAHTHTLSPPPLRDL